MTGKQIENHCDKESFSRIRANLKAWKSTNTYDAAIHVHVLLEGDIGQLHLDKLKKMQGLPPLFINISEHIQYVG